MSDAPRPFLPSDIPAARAELQRQRARNFISVVRAIARHGNGAVDYRDRLSPEVASAVKAAVFAGSLGSADDLNALAALSLGWVASLREGGPVFDAMLPSMRAAPMGAKFAMSTVALTVTEVNEGAPKPVARLTLAGGEPLLPRKAAAIVVASAELMRLSEAGALMDAELRAGVTAAVDSMFLTDLLAATTPIASAGATAGATIADFESLAAAVPLSSTSRPFLVYRPDDLKKLATKWADGTFVWPDLTVTGGAMRGIPVLSSDQLPDGTAMLVDAAQIAANAGEAVPSASTQAMVEMSDYESLDASPQASDVQTSLWQHDLVGVRVERTFGFRLLRASAAASLSGVAY